MMLARYRLAAVLVVGWLALGTTAADTGPRYGRGSDRALRDVVGSVEGVNRIADEEGTLWLEVTLGTGEGETLEARVAPIEVLEASDFRLEVGDMARVRMFVDEEPPGVSRIRNLTSGQTLRLRCLRGNPIWSLREPGATAGGTVGGADRGHRRGARGPS